MAAQRPTGSDRALNAALSGSAFTPRVGSSALHSATRHVERWAPEATAGRNRPMASLGFVDRLVSPWLQTAQRSASMRMFSQFNTQGNPAFAANDGKPVSWVFPRPWYQDELDWMAASRMQARQGTESVFTTRGTYVAPSAMPTLAPAMPPAQAPAQRVMPEALFEYVAPSLSVAAGSITAGRSPTQPVFDASGGARMPAAPIAATFANPSGQQALRPADAYSPLVPLAAVQAAELMARAVMPGFTSHVSSVGTATLPTAAGSLNQVFASLMERAAIPTELPSTRIAERAPMLETPPAPRAPSAPQAPAQLAAQHQASQFAEQRARVAEVARIAQIAEAQRTAQAPAEMTTSVAQVERELLARVAPQASSSLVAPTAVVAESPATPIAESSAVSSAVDVEQARIEARVQQRLAERRQAEQVATHRLHEQARIQAAEHARASLPTLVAAPTAPVAAPRPVAPPPSAEVLAAISALPPALAQQLAGATSARAAIAAIAELTESLRTVELMAHGTATSTAFEATRGPRLLMPAGIGGLVSTLAPSSGAMPTPSLAGRPQAFGAASVAPAAPSARPMVSSMGTMGSLAMPSLSFVAPRETSAPTSALAATAGQAPAALGHVAWADRWLARFAGASEQSLATFSAGTRAGSASRLALAEAAPGEVFIAPMLDTERQSPRVVLDASGRPMTAAPLPRLAGPTSSTAAAAPGVAPTGSAAPAPASRVDDSAAASDDELASVAFAVAQQRVARIAPPTPVVAEPHFERMGAADVLAHHAPSAPDAGFAAQLGSSPFAPALRHVLPIATAPSFDVRALFGAGLSSTFLAGLIASDSHMIETAAGLPSSTAMEFVPRIGAFADASAAGASLDGFEPGRAVEGWDQAYVAPEALEGPRTVGFGDVSDDLASYAAMPTGAMPAEATAPAMAPAQLAQIESARAAVAQLQTLRTALLAWDIEVDASGAPTSAPSLAAASALSSSTSGAPARQMLDAMSLPLLGGLGDYSADEERTAAVEGASWMAPGMLANRAQSWSVAQERSSADLSFDFVPPELILAARVYGLGPAEAAQAARLAVAGPGQLSAMAGTVDRTFVQALAIEAERRGSMPGYAGSSTMAAGSAGAAATSVVPTGGTPASWSASADAFDAPMASPLSGSAPTMTPLAATPLAASAFGVERRTPRGATLWPAGTVAALGLNAATPDGESSMSVAALELLAAQSVAELGTFVALGEHAPMASTRGATFDASTNVDDVATPGALPNLATAQQVLDGRRAAASDTAPGPDGAPGAEPPEADVISQARGMVDVNRRIRFDALYVALGQTGPGRTLSPAARAARALALAGRAEDGVSLSARERAAAAWDVLPVVFAEDYDREDAAEEAALIGGSSLRGVERRAALRGWDGTLVAGDFTRSSSSSSFGRADSGADFAVDGRPGLSSLSARAGEALGSYVTQQAIPTSSSSSGSYTGNEGAVLRAPTAAQEMVQTGRPSGRAGGGETEIPAWFEAAARRMFADKRSSGGAEGISLAELTLVNNAPSGAIAADSVSAGKATPNASVSHAGEKDEDSGLDIESLANDIFEHVEQMKKQARMLLGDFT